MTLHVIVDHGTAVPGRLRQLIGIDSFDKLIFRRRTLAAIVQAAVRDADLPPPLAMRSEADWAELAGRVSRAQQPADRFLVCPSSVVAARGQEVLTKFFRQARFSPQNLLLPAANGPEWEGWALMFEPLFRDYVAARADGDVAGFFDRHRQDFVRMPERLGLVDLTDEVTLLDFLSGAFDARFFNAIVRGKYTITKASTDKAKLEREYKLWEMLPPRMQMFFLRPFDFKDNGETASYEMERLFVPDMALQWLHSALTEAEFGRFLDHVLHFVSIRAERPAAPGEAAAAADNLFVTKVRERIEAMKRGPEYASLEPLIVSACGSLDALFERYLVLFERMRDRLPTDRMVIGHGDLCFSNILYAKASRVLKLIDPRGASSEKDLWTHPFYDLAKLSHSIMGSYDFVNQDLFEVQVDEAIRPRLVLDRARPEWAAAAFRSRLDAMGLSLPLIRLCEASLFISMLPLHVDRPRKVLGFVLIANGILDEVEQQR